MRTLVVIFAITFGLHLEGRIHHNWVRMDKRLIRDINEVNEREPVQVAKFFADNNARQDTSNLGFGWNRISCVLGGGYVSLRSVFYYRNDTLISYTVNPELPDEEVLQHRYLGWYSKTFFIDSGIVYPLSFGRALILKPLSTYSGKLAIARISLLEYMTPESGLTYGRRGGIANTILANRRAFIDLVDSLTIDEAEMIMYSINPASRFTGIEYYWRNKRLYSDTSRLDAWVERCFVEVPKIHTLNGCIGSEQSSRELVMRFSSTY